MKRAEDAADEMDAMLHSEDPNRVSKAYEVLQRWYRHSGDRPPKPSRKDLNKVTAEWQTLYTRPPQPYGEEIPVTGHHDPINDEIPTEDEIARAVRGLKNGKAAGPSGLKAEHLKTWLKAAEREVEPDPEAWQTFVELIQYVFEHQELPECMPWSIMVLLPKGNGSYRGIGLLEIPWKVIKRVIDSRVGAVVTFHDCVHGFTKRRGCDTAIIEAKLAQELASIAQVAWYTIFLDLRKAYDAIDRARTMEILRKYGLGPRLIAILWAFWDNQKVVPRQSGFHGKPIIPERGTVQGGIFSPKAFNILTDAVIRHWLLELENQETADNGFGDTVADRLALFYADDGAIGARDHEWLQRAMVQLCDVFKRMGLETNTAKTESMTCYPGHVRTQLNNLSYERMMTGQGPTYKARRRQRVTCPECQVEMAAGSLTQHLQTQHGKAANNTFDAERVLDAEANPGVWVAHFDATAEYTRCPVPGCPGGAKNPAGMRSHHRNRHPWDTVIIPVEHPTALPKCDLCDLQHKHAGFPRHSNTLLCRDFRAKTQRRQYELDLARSQAIVFSVNDVDLSRVDNFRYLGRVLTESNSDWPTLNHNLKRAKQKWARISRVLSRDGASNRAAGMFYKAVVQTVLLYGCESWDVTDGMMAVVLRGFHHSVARRITGKVGRLQPNGTWVYPDIAEALAECGLFSMFEYVRRRQQRMVQHIATRPMQDLIPAVEDTNGSRLRWWCQPTVLETNPRPEDDPANFAPPVPVN